MLAGELRGVAVGRHERAIGMLLGARWRGDDNQGGSN
jgi:hypothetical protein